MRDKYFFIVGEILHIGNQYNSFANSSSLTKNRMEGIISLSKKALGKRRIHSVFLTIREGNSPMMKATKYLDPSGEIIIHRRLSPLEAYNYVHAAQLRLSMDEIFIQQMALYRIQAEKASSKKGYVRCTIKIGVSYENLQNERKLPGHPTSTYGDIVFFIKSATEGTSDFLGRDEETYFYANRLGILSSILRIKVKWDQEQSRWNISAKPVNPKKIQRSGIVLIVPYNSHYDTVY